MTLVVIKVIKSLGIPTTALKSKDDLGNSESYPHIINSKLPPPPFLKNLI